MKYLQALFVLLLALVLAGFIQQNSGSVTLKYFGWASPELPLALFIVMAFAVGYAMAVLLGFYGNIRNRVRAARAERELKRVSSDLESARAATRALSGQATGPEGEDVTEAAEAGEEEQTPETEAAPGTGDRTGVLGAEEQGEGKEESV